MLSKLSNPYPEKNKKKRCSEITFTPTIVIIRENALEYPLGKKLKKSFSEQEEVDLHIVASRGPFPLDYDLPFQEKFHRAKNALVVSVRKVNKFQTCKPSAHYQLPLVSGCPGRCHYCYLSTNMGKNPYVKVYVNREEILQKAKTYMEERSPETTVFEGAATSDPLPVEKWTGSLARAIEFFAHNPKGRVRFVTKFTAVDSLLDLEHGKKTEFRFSLNAKNVIKKFEPGTPGVSDRIEAAGKVYRAGYPTGFLLAPLMIYENWKKEYEDLLTGLKKELDSPGNHLSFELITHRFTERAKNVIEKAYPNTELPMNEEERRFKYGQFGYGKYIYPPEKMEEIKDHLESTINKHFPEAEIKYFV
ncbi:MAG: spore photoproduct lyase [Halanaerobiales bacterium]